MSDPLDFPPPLAALNEESIEHAFATLTRFAELPREEVGRLLAEHGITAGLREETMRRFLVQTFGSCDPGPVGQTAAGTLWLGVVVARIASEHANILGAVDE